MRILHVDLGRELRGGQHQVLLLLRTLHQAGHKSMLMALPQSPLYERASSLGFDVMAASWTTLVRMASGYDLVHAHDARAHTWAALACWKPFVVSRRVAFPVRGSIGSKLKYGRATRYLAVSKSVERKLNLAGVPQSKIDVVYDAVEAPESIPAWNGAAPVIALGTEDPQKGRDLIERAAEMARIPVTFSNDLAKDFTSAAAFVYVSRSEGFGSAALLAMSMGVPLIASSVDGLAEVFENNISGLGVANHAASISAAMQRLMANPELAQSLADNGHRRARNLFNPHLLLNSTLASYRRALVDS